MPHVRASTRAAAGPLRRVVHGGFFATVLTCVLGVASYLFGRPMAIELHWLWMALISIGIVVLAVARFIRSLRAQRHGETVDAVLDAVPHIFFVKDARGRYEALNAEFERLFHVEAPKVLGKTDAEVFGPGLRDRFVAQDQEVIASGVARTYQNDIMVDGQLHHFEVRKQPIYDRRAQSLGLVGLSRDVTIERQVQRDLEQSRSDLALALSVGELGVWRSAVRLARHASLRDRGFLDGPVAADHRMREIFGLGEAQEVSYRQLLMMVHPQDRQRVVTRLVATYRGRQGTYRKQFRIVRADGQERTLEVRGSLSVRAAPGDGGKEPPARLVAFIGIAKDISDEEALKASLVTKAEEARLATDAKARFLAMMSHEVRTPLSGVLGMIDLVIDTPLSDDQRAMLMRCRESSVSLLTIINDILDFSKIEAGMLDIESRPLSIGSLVEDVCATFEAETARKGIALGFEVDEAIPQFVVGDSVRLRQVLGNLIGNAVKFTHRGGVRVRVQRTAGGELELAVQDTGIGIDPRATRTLFEPFRQADIATTRRYGGTGLGLTIVRQLVELMHGSVRCESAPGEGSRFTVTLPLVPWVPSVGAASGRRRDPHRLAIDAASAAQPDATPAVSGQGQRVLLAEDHPVNREVITRQLLKLGYACECAEDGQQAWEMLQAAAQRGAGYALLLTDCHMPRLDGYELTQRLRAQEAAKGLARLPIVALTANALQGEAERCLALGMDAYLSKPLQLEDLREVLARVLGSAASRDEAGRPYGRLMTLCEGDAGKVAHLVQLFVSATQDDLKAMDRAAAAADAPALRQLAHRLSSACHQLDEDPAVRALQAVEQLAQAPGPLQPQALQAWGAARAALEAVLARARAFARAFAPGQV